MYHGLIGDYFYMVEYRRVDNYDETKYKRLIWKNFKNKKI